MANYVLKKPMWTDDKMNRLVKTIRDNATKDRKEAEDLLKLCKEGVGELNGVLLQAVTAGENADTVLSADTLHKLINASTQALNQMGIANERLLKLAQTMQKYQLKEMDAKKNAGNGNTGTGSMFAQLDAMTKKDKDSNA